MVMYIRCPNCDVEIAAPKDGFYNPHWDRILLDGKVMTCGSCHSTFAVDYQTLYEKD
jgi:hypothetical protein